MTKTEWEAFLNRLDKRYVGKVYKALREVYSSFTDDLRKYGQVIAFQNLQAMDAKMGEVIMTIHKEAGVYQASKTLRELRKEKLQVKRGFGYNEEWIRDIQNYFRLYLLNKSVLPISETTRKRILEVLNQGIEEGWGVEKMAKEIENLPEIRRRARTIVRTETVRAANYGTFLGADKYEYEVEKEWVAINDTRTRATHRHADESKREVEERFSNGCLFPGDPSAPAKETIMCRCRLNMVAKRDSRGRLIPKRSNISVRPNGSLIDAFSGIAVGISAGIQLGNLISNATNE